MVLPGPGAAMKMAYYNGVGDLTDANITVSGVANDLTFDNNTTIFVDNIQSTDGDLNFGGGVTNLITMASSNAITIDATNSITLGHVGFTVSIVDRLDVMNIDTSTIDSSGTLIIGPTAPNVLIGSPGIPVVIDDSVQVDNIDADVINSTTGTLTIGSTTPTLNIGMPLGNVNIVDNSVLVVGAIDHGVNAFLYNTCPFVSMGGFGGTIQLNGSINFAVSGSATLNYYTDAKEFAMMASGPFAPQVVGWYSIQRLNTMATLVLKWNVAAVLATANSPMALTPALAIPFFPASVQAFACQVRRTGVLSELGTVSISNTGDIGVIPTATGTFSIGDFCDFNTISFTYELTI